MFWIENQDSNWYKKVFHVGKNILKSFIFVKENGSKLKLKLEIKMYSYCILWEDKEETL